MRIVPRATYCLLAVLLPAFAVSCASKPAAAPKASPLIRHEFTHPALGTRFRVVVYCPDSAAIGRAEIVVIRRLAQLEEIFNGDQPTSELSQIHANAGLGSVRVSDALYRLLAGADRFAGRSGGGFDLTTGAYADLWERAIETETLPSDEQLAGARERVGRSLLRLDPINRTVHLTHEGVRLDLRRLATADACDLVFASLREAGLSSALVDAGGRIAVGDPPPGTQGWRIRINDAAPKSGHRNIVLVRCAIASSDRLDDVVVSVGGRAYARRVHPLTGIGSGNLVAVTVVANRTWQADALARAAAVLGKTDGAKLVASTPNVMAWFHYPPTPAQPIGAPPKPATRPANPGE